MSTTFRFQLPLLVADQAQKEVTHNEAIQDVDRLLQISVKSRVLLAPPLNPSIGDGWIVGPGSTGNWEGKSDAIAIFEGSGWAFVMPRSGLMAWIEDENSMAVWNGSWSAGWPVSRFELAATPAVNIPMTGSTVDVELRQSFASLVGALQLIGLIS